MEKKVESVKRKLNFEELSENKKLKVEDFEEFWEKVYYCYRKGQVEQLLPHQREWFDFIVGNCCMPEKFVEDDFYKRINWIKKEEVKKFTSRESRTEFFLNDHSICYLCLESLWEKLE